MSDLVIESSKLADALSEQLLLYTDEKVEALNQVGERAIKKLVKLTKQTAPIREGDFVKAITYTAKRKVTGDNEYTWGAKSPESRKTHLLVNGHDTANGGRVPGDPFLENALETVLPDYEADVTEVLAND